MVNEDMKKEVILALGKQTGNDELFQKLLLQTDSRFANPNPNATNPANTGKTGGSGGSGNGTNTESFGPGLGGAGTEKNPLHVVSSVCKY